ncbi:MAG: CpsD/CapB family tyrosine-protein kinase [Lachnospiraceae bacterium]|nr:CpsD/CapB family tyrosine-protein kinase [Lachnospiraceae bacterium]
MIDIELKNIEEPDFRTDEAYKQLRTNLIFCGDEVKTIVFTSCHENEGKSEVSFQVARSLAEAGHKVLLLDCDIRKSVLTSRYEVEKKVDGLSDFLAGRATLDDILCKTNIPNLLMVFAGTNVPNPADLLASKRFPPLLEGFRQALNYVIIDCPPLGVVIDAAVVAKYADGAVIVIESNTNSYKVVQGVKDQLSKSDCRILGAVINKAERQSKGRYGGYYGDYYGGYGYGKRSEASPSKSNE